VCGESVVEAIGRDVVWDRSGEPVGVTSKVVWDRLRVDHFPIKSQQEFLVKRASGHLLRTNSDWDKYFAMHDHNEVEDPVPLAVVQRTKEEIKSILSQLS
jgi:hypothetical protein